MKYDELRGNLMTYEQNQINKYNKDDKKKTDALKNETSDNEQEVDEYQNEGMTFINKGVKICLDKKTETSTIIQQL